MKTFEELPEVYARSIDGNGEAVILSVLIADIASRREMSWKLFDKLAAQAAGLPVEILLLLDNRQRSVGKKREALIEIAKGDYVAFVDDDDDVSDDYIRAICEVLMQVSPDVVVFDSICTLNDGPDVRVSHDFTHPDEQYNPAGFKRGAWHIHAWDRYIASQYRFPDTNKGEDEAWLKRVRGLVQSYAKIDKPLYHYRYSDLTTEASK